MLKNANYINKLIIDLEGLSEKAQVGVDLTVKSIELIKEGARIPREGKTRHAPTQSIEASSGGYYLSGGSAYSVTFDQGLEELPPTKTAFIKQRSSLNRNGCLVTGSVFDPGFHCKNLGATIYPTESIFIDEHARIAQIIIQENERVDNLYDGQYKEKK